MVHYFNSERGHQKQLFCALCIYDLRVLKKDIISNTAFTYFWFSKDASSRFRDFLGGRSPSLHTWDLSPIFNIQKRKKKIFLIKKASNIQLTCRQVHILIRFKAQQGTQNGSLPRFCLIRYFIYDSYHPRYVVTYYGMHTYYTWPHAATHEIFLLLVNLLLSHRASFSLLLYHFFYPHLCHALHVLLRYHGTRFHYREKLLLYYVIIILYTCSAIVLLRILHHYIF